MNRCECLTELSHIALSKALEIAIKSQEKTKQSILNKTTNPEDLKKTIRKIEIGETKLVTRLYSPGSYGIAIAPSFKYKEEIGQFPFSGYGDTPEEAKTTFLKEIRAKVPIQERHWNEAILPKIKPLEENIAIFKGLLEDIEKLPICQIGQSNIPFSLMNIAGTED